MTRRILCTIALGMVAAQSAAEKNMARIDSAFADKSKAQIADYKNALRHCFMARHWHSL